MGRGRGRTGFGRASEARLRRRHQRGGTPTGPTAGAEAEVDRAHAALDRLATQRGRGVVRVPDRLLVALEAAASVSLDHPRGAVPHVIGALTRQPVDRSPVVARFQELAAAMDGNDDQGGAAAIIALLPNGKRHRGLTALQPGPSSMLDAARHAASISRAHTYGSDSDQIGRSLLATWPARAGVLAHIPAPISRSLADAGVRSVRGLAFDDHVSLLLAAISDAADRALRAEVELIRLHDRYVAQLHARGEHRARGIVSLLISDPIVTVDAIVAGFDVSPAGARAGLDELTATGWLARVDSGDNASAPEWLTIGVLDTLIAAFEEPRGARSPQSRRLVGAEEG